MLDKVPNVFFFFFNSLIAIASYELERVVRLFSVHTFYFHNSPTDWSCHCFEV